MHQQFEDLTLRNKSDTFSKQVSWQNNHHFLPVNKSINITRLRSQLRRYKKMPEVLK